jgi:anti-anti-sigma regulatory factor
MTGREPIVERHPNSATVYLHGTLTERLALRTLELLHLLPLGVRRTRVDLQGIERFDERGLGSLASALSHWKHLTGGETIVTGAGGVASLHP